MKAPIKPGKTDPVSSRSIVILKKFPGGEWEMEGWKTESDGTKRRCLESAGCGGVLHRVTQDSFRATSAEDAKTLIRVACTKGKSIRDFQQGTAIGAIYATECTVEVFDLRSNSMLGSKLIKADKVDELGKTGVLGPNAILKTQAAEALVNPYPVIKEYLKQFGNI